MIRRLQRLPQGPRLVIFIFMLVGGLLLLGALTIGLILLTINSAPRQTAQALVDGVSVREFAALPGDDAYPSTLAVSADGAVYTASFVSGAVWSISPDGQTVTEIPDTRETFGGVTALAARPDDTLLAAASSERDSSWAVWSITPGGEITEFASITDSRGFLSPFDIALDIDGGVYVVDRARAEIWRWNADGTGGELWWSLLTPPESVSLDDEAATPTPLPATSQPAPTGLAYDPVSDSLLVADPDANTITRIPRSRAASEVIYRYVPDNPNRPFPPGLDGIAVAADGTIYVTALDQKGLAIVTPESSALTYVAGNFRGPSGLAFGPDGQLYVANFDSLALAQPGVRPQLPFAVDVVTFE